MPIPQVVDSLKELSEDSTIPKNIKLKLSTVIEILNDPRENSIKVSKALHELEDVVDDSNLQPYSRTQVWQIISMLEAL